MKKIIAMVLCLLLVLCLTACSSTPPASTQSSSDASQSADEGAAYAAASSATELPPFDPIDWSTVEEAPASDFTYEIVQDNDPLGDDIIDVVRLLSYTGSASVIKMPDMIDGMYVRRAAAAMFQNNTTITHVALPKYLRTGAQSSKTSSMFEGCTSLLQVRMPEDCVLIPARMFSNCTALREVTFPINKALYAYGGVDLRAFENCVSLTSITLPSGIMLLDESAFAGCVNLETVIAQGVSTIGKNVFEGCSALTTLEVCGDQPVYNGLAFIGCTSLKDITILHGDQSVTATLVKENGGYYIVNTRSDGSISSNLAFVLPTYEGDTISLRADVREIGAGAFADSCIKYIELPASVREIEIYAFYNCPNLETVSVAAGSQLHTISSRAFENCPVLKKLDFSNAPIELSIIDDLDDLPALEQVFYPGEDPNATPAPTFSEEEIVSAIEAALDPYRSQMEAAGYTYKINMNGDKLSNVSIDTLHSKTADLNSQLLHDIAVAVVNTPQAGFDSRFCEDVANFSFTEQGEVETPRHRVSLTMGYMYYSLDINQLNG